MVISYHILQNLKRQGVGYSERFGYGLLEHLFTGPYNRSWLPSESVWIVPGTHEPVERG